MIENSCAFEPIASPGRRELCFELLAFVRYDLSSQSISLLPAGHIQSPIT